MTLELLDNFYSITHTPIQTLDPISGKILKRGFEDFNDCCGGFDYDQLSSSEIPCRIEVEENLFVQIIEYMGKTFIIGPYTNCKKRKDFVYKSETVEQYLIDIFDNLYNDMVKSHKPYCFHVKRALEYMRAHFRENISLDSIAEYLKLNKCYFCVLMKEETGMTFSKYLNKIRIDEAKRLLSETNDTVSTISESVGFNSQSYFIVVFKEFMEMTPLEYRFKKREEEF